MKLLEILLFILSLVIVTENILLRCKLILWKMESDLERWLEFGTGMDIYNVPDQRKEYQFYTKQVANKYELDEQYPAKQVLLKIREDLAKPEVFKKVYFYLLLIIIKGYRIK